MKHGPDVSETGRQNVWDGPEGWNQIHNAGHDRFCPVGGENTNPKKGFDATDMDLPLSPSPAGKQEALRFRHGDPDTLLPQDGGHFQGAARAARV